jgi:hypothetical protein
MPARRAGISDPTAGCRPLFWSTGHLPTGPVPRRRSQAARDWIQGDSLLAFGRTPQTETNSFDIAFMVALNGVVMNIQNQLRDNHDARALIAGTLTAHLRAPAHGGQRPSLRVKPTAERRRLAPRPAPRPAAAALSISASSSAMR